MNNGLFLAANKLRIDKQKPYSQFDIQISCLVYIKLFTINTQIWFERRKIYFQFDYLYCSKLEYRTNSWTWDVTKMSLKVIVYYIFIQ